MPQHHIITQTSEEKPPHVLYKCIHTHTQKLTGFPNRGKCAHQNPDMHARLLVAS